MSIFVNQTPLAEANDAALVMYSLGGDRNAFCQIVTRYQNLLCSLAYSAIGDIKNSEDIAQEVFVEAWKKLENLHDPEKLKAWLCGILRFKVSHHHRKEDTQPIKGAAELDEQTLDESEGSKLEQAAIKQQQHALMWKVLDQIDETYREPLILFYREQQSIERVAAELDLSQDTVKQRLSRGRKLLKSALSDFVEDGLTSSKPGVAFTTTVMAAISGISPSTKAAVMGAGAAKTGSIFSWATMLTFLAPLSGLVSSFFGLRSSLDLSRTQQERRLVIKSVTLFLLFAAVYVAGMFGLEHLASNNAQNAWNYALEAQALALGFVISYLVLYSRMNTTMRSVRANGRIFEPQAFADEADSRHSSKREFKSRFTLFGIPLVHMQFGLPEADDKPAFGWIAGGNRAYGLLFAWGGIAIAPVSVGIISVGVVSIGAVGIGLFGIGTVAIGLVGFGASAIAYKAYGAFSALGWEGAFSGGFSIAKTAAIAPNAYAAQVNNEQASTIMDMALFGQNYQWLLAAVVLFIVIPAAWHSSVVRQRTR